MAARQHDPRRSDPRFQRLLAATREAAGRGYDAVSMRELATTTRMSLTTIYQFCSSKDQLIADAHVDRMERFRDRILERPPAGPTAQVRVMKVIDGLVAGLDRSDALSCTLMRAMYSHDPGVRSSRGAVSRSFEAMILSAIGSALVDDRDAVVSTLGHVVNSAMFGWVSGRFESDEVAVQLAQAVQLLLRSAVEPTGVSEELPAGTSDEPRHGQSRPGRDP